MRVLRTKRLVYFYRLDVERQRFFVKRAARALNLFSYCVRFVVESRCHWFVRSTQLYFFFVFFCLAVGRVSSAILFCTIDAWLR